MSCDVILVSQSCRNCCLVTIIKSTILLPKIIEPVVTCCSRCTASCIINNYHDITLANLSLYGTAHTLSLKSDAARPKCGCGLQPVFLSNRLRVQHLWGWVLSHLQGLLFSELQLLSLQ